MDLRQNGTQIISGKLRLSPFVLSHFTEHTCHNKDLITKHRLTKMYAPAFTKDPKRIARLESNFREGQMRERLPEELRCQLDIQSLEVDANKIRHLFRDVATKKASAVQSRRDH
jgi:hypothetical protein